MVTKQDLIEGKTFRVIGFSSKFHAKWNGESGAMYQDYGPKNMSDEYNCAITNLSDDSILILGTVMTQVVEHTYKFEELELV